MPLPLQFRSDVFDDVRSAADWYESKQRNLGQEFVAEFWTAVDRIEEFPEHFAIAPNGFRPCPMKRFPYVVHFVIEPECILVLAVMAGARDDSAFQDRG